MAHTPRVPTALILILAANTAFNGFPLLASILAQDRFLPRQLHTLGDRLAFSNGIIALALVAAVLIFAFDGVPWQLHSTSRRDLQRVRPLPGDTRRGITPQRRS